MWSSVVVASRFSAHHGWKNNYLNYLIPYQLKPVWALSSKMYIQWKTAACYVFFNGSLNRPETMCEFYRRSAVSEKFWSKNILILVLSKTNTLPVSIWFYSLHFCHMTDWLIDWINQFWHWPLSVYITQLLSLLICWVLGSWMPNLTPLHQNSLYQDILFLFFQIIKSVDFVSFAHCSLSEFLPFITPFMWGFSKLLPQS